MSKQAKIAKPASKASKAIANIQRKKKAGSQAARESRSKINFLNSVEGGSVQAKLKLGAPNDKYEQEADQMADRVMRSPMPDSVTSSNGVESVQRKCAECESKEEQSDTDIAIQRKEIVSDTGGTNPDISKTSLRESVTVQRKMNHNGTLREPQGARLKVQGSTLRPSKGALQRKEEDEEIQRFTTDRGRGPPMGDFSSKLSQSKGSGQPMDSATGSFMSSRFGADFSNVKIHTDNNAASMSNSINAKAFTHQNHIYFNQGQYQPNTHGGKTLLAHELTHTIQQGAVSNNVQRKRTSCEEETSVSDRGPPGVVQPKSADSETSDEGGFSANLFNVSEDSIQSKSEGNNGLPLKGFIQRDPLVCTDEDFYEETLESAPVCEAVLDEEVVRGTLATEGLELDDDDVAVIARRFPLGFRLTPIEIVVGSYGNNFINGIKITGYTVVDNSQTPSSLRLIVFDLGKGRSLLVTNTNGTGSIVFDAGSGGAKNSNGQAAIKLRAAYQNVFSSGLAENPVFLTISHFDSDHINSIRRIFELPNFGETAIRVSRQQIDSAIGRTDWNRMEIRLSETQSIIRINVSGASGVHVNTEVIGNIQLTEYRLVEAHDRLMRDRSTYNKNATSEMAVVRDLVSGRTMAFTGDIEGRTLYEIIDVVGRDAFRRVLGGEGRNLEIAEIPHHGGAVSRRHVEGMLRYYQLAFEASKGDITFITQSSPNFSTGDSASLHVLESANLPTRVSLADPSPSGQSRITSYGAGGAESITLNSSAIVETRRLVGNNTDVLSRAYKHRHEILTLQENLRALSGVFEGSRHVFPDLAGSVETMSTRLTTMEAELNTSLESVWTSMRAAGASNGLRSSTELAGIRTAIEQLNTRVGELRIEPIKGGLEMHMNGIRAYNNFFINLGQMFEALEQGNSERIRELKAEQIRLFGQARAVLGEAGVESHVREAWREVRRVWTPRMIRSVARRMSLEAISRRMNQDFRSELFSSLSGHMQLVRELQRMGAGHVTPIRPISPGRRAGAGILAGIEVLRIGLEVGVVLKESSEAEEARHASNRSRGLRELSWWQSFGVQPELALIHKSYWTNTRTIISGLSNEEILAIVRDDDSEVEYEKMVILNVSNEDLTKVMDALIVQVSFGADWIETIEGVSGGPWFKQFGDIWGVRLWSEEDQGYRYHERSVINEPLTFLQGAVRDNQEALLDHQVSQSSRPISTIENSAIFYGADRYVMVYNSAGRITSVNFGEEQPQFFVLGTYEIPIRSGSVVHRETVKKVRAANMSTYDKLSGYYWTKKVGVSMDGQGNTHDQISIFRNSAGWGYVYEDSLMVTMGSMVEHATRELEQSGSQPKLKVGAPDDKYEKEADQMADLVMRSPMEEEKVQRKCDQCEKEEQIQRKSLNGGLRHPVLSSIEVSKPGLTQRVMRKAWDKAESYNPYASVSSDQEEMIQRKADNQNSPVVTDSFSSGLSSTKGSGKPMDSGTRDFMENRFGSDFGNVRIHTGSRATSLNNQIQAKAFTHGNDIYFNQGQYNPSSPSGKHLLAHELTHTIQQTGGVERKIQRKDFAERYPEDLKAGFQGELDIEMFEKKGSSKGYWEAGMSGWIKFTPSKDSSVPDNDKISLVQIVQVQNLESGKVSPLSDKHPGVSKDASTKSTGTPDTVDEEYYVDKNFTNILAGTEPHSKYYIDQGSVGASAGGVKNQTSQITGKKVTLSEKHGKKKGTSVETAVLTDGPGWTKSAIYKFETYAQSDTHTYGGVSWGFTIDATDLRGNARDLSTFSTADGMVNFVHVVPETPKRLTAETSIAKDAIERFHKHGNKKASTTTTPTTQSEDKAPAESPEKEKAPDPTPKVSDPKTQEPEKIQPKLKDSISRGPPQIQRGIFGKAAEKVASYIPGYDLIKLLLGKSPITGEKVERSGLNIIKAFLGLIPVAGPILFDQLVKAKAAEKAGKWLDKELIDLNITWDGIKALFAEFNRKRTYWFRVSKNIEIAKAVFRPTWLRIKRFAGKVSKNVKKFIFEGVIRMSGKMGEKVLAFIQKSGKFLDKIFDDPGQFARNMLTAVINGFIKFNEKIGHHLKAGLLAFIFGSVSKKGVTVPKKFNMFSIGMLVLQLLNITWETIEEKLKKRLGEARYERLKKTVEFVRVLATEGIKGVIKIILQKGKDLVSGIIDSIRNWVMTKVVASVAVQFATLFNPAGALFSILKLLYKLVEVLINNWDRIVVMAVGLYKAVEAAANNKTKNASEFVTKTLGNFLPVAIGFMAGYLGLGSVAAFIGKTVQKAGKKIWEILTKMINWIVTKAKKLWKSGKGAVKKGIGKFFNWAKIKKKFKNKKGESHSLFYKTKPAKVKGKKTQRAVLWMASENPAPFETWLHRALAVPEKDRSSGLQKLIDEHKLLEAEELKLEESPELDQTKADAILKTIDDKIEKIKGMVDDAGLFRNDGTIPLSRVAFQMKGEKAGRVIAKPLTKHPGNTKGEKSTAAGTQNSPEGWGDVTTLYNKIYRTVESYTPKDMSKHKKEIVEVNNKNLEVWYRIGKDDVWKPLFHKKAVRAHILNEDLHGPAKKWNLAPASQVYNNAMIDFDRELKKQVFKNTDHPILWVEIEAEYFKGDELLDKDNTPVPAKEFFVKKINFNKVQKSNDGKNWEDMKGLPGPPSQVEVPKLNIGTKEYQDAAVLTWIKDLAEYKDRNDGDDETANDAKINNHRLFAHLNHYPKFIVDRREEIAHKAGYKNYKAQKPRIDPAQKEIIFSILTSTFENNPRKSYSTSDLLDLVKADGRLNSYTKSEISVRKLRETYIEKPRVSAKKLKSGNYKFKKPKK